MAGTPTPPNGENRDNYYSGRIAVLPTMINVTAMGLLSVLGFNAARHVPGLNKVAIKAREWTHKPFEIIGGKNFKHAAHPENRSIGDTGIDFVLDMVIGLITAAVVGRTEWGQKAYTAVNSVIENKTQKFSNLFGKLFGAGPTPA